MAQAYVVTGLLWGDEGKGSIVDYLVRRTGARLVVRHNGGAQAAHNVVTDDGRHHTFAQWGAGTFAGAATFLSEHMVVSPIAMENEAAALDRDGFTGDPWLLMNVDARATVVTSLHVMANRARERLRGRARHGSCGMGIGEAYCDKGKPYALRFGDLCSERKIRAALEDQRDAMRAFFYEAGDMPGVYRDPVILDIEASRMRKVFDAVRLVDDPDDLLRKHDTVVCEGAQGVLLDMDRGVQPYTTWSNTTGENAVAMLRPLGFDVKKIGVVRAYATRHGRGPFRSYSQRLTEHPEIQHGEHNAWNQWQEDFRCGWFDVDAVRGAVAIEGSHCLAVTCLDKLTKVENPKLCLGTDVDPLLSPIAMPTFGDAIDALVGLPVLIASHGPAAKDKECLRVPAWLTP